MGFNIGKAIGTYVTGGLSDAARLLSGGKGGASGGGVGYKIPKFAMRKTDEFVKNDAAPQVGGADGASAISRRFAGIKERMGNQVNAQGQMNADALKRRFASQGAVGSGAEIKAQMLNEEKTMQAKNDALIGVEAMEAEQMMNRDLAQADMDFKQKVFNFERGSKMHELDLAERQQQQDAVATQINARTAQEMSKPPKQGLLSGLIGDLI